MENFLETQATAGSSCEWLRMIGSDGDMETEAEPDQLVECSSRPQGNQAVQEIPQGEWQLRCRG